MRPHTKVILVLLLGFGGWKAWQLHQHGPDPLFSAKRAMNMGNYDQAVEHLGIALVERPDDELEIYMRLGLCYDELERYDQAVQHFARATQYYEAHPRDDDVLRAKRRWAKLDRRVRFSEP